MGDSELVPGQGVADDDSHGVEVGAGNDLEPAAGEVHASRDMDMVPCK